jgi:hypothetical protein
VARALMHDWIERYASFTAALTAWYDSWDGKPLAGEGREALAAALDDYAQLLAVADSPDADRRSQLERARSAVAFLSAEQQLKPRQVLDVSDAMRHVDTISKIITRAEQVRAHGTISLDRVRLFMFAIDRGLEVEVEDVALRDRIRRMMFAIRV